MKKEEIGNATLQDDGKSWVIYLGNNGYFTTKNHDTVILFEKLCQIERLNRINIARIELQLIKLQRK